jgi:integrase
MSKSGVDAIVSDYFTRLRRALAPLPRNRRNQLLEDLREHVTLARAGLSEETELSVREIFDHLGTPEDIAAEALAASPRTPGRWRRRLGPLTRRKAAVVATAVAVLAAGQAGAEPAGARPAPPASRPLTPTAPRRPTRPPPVVPRSR